MSFFSWRRVVRWTVPVTAVLVLAACGRGDDGDDEDDGGGFPEAEADADARDVPPDGPLDGDAGEEADAPDVEGSSDVGEEADAPERCPCLPLPAVCRVAAADTPVFAPPVDDLEQQFLDLVACADRTIRIAAYETDWECLLDALLAKLEADPDLVVEYVTDDDTCPRGTDGLLTCALARLDAHDRAAVVEDDRSGLMHHKFALFDDLRVWVASANFTRNSFCFDYNNALVVDEPAIVAGYLQEFQRFFGDREFGPRAPAAAVTGGAYALYFSPETPISSPPPWFVELQTAVAAATTSVEVMISAWTRTEISDALIAAAGRGVTVRALVSDLYVDDAPAQALIAAGVPVRQTGMHSKVLVVDERRVASGSANWSENAWSNNENSLWVDDPAVGAAFHAEFERVWAVARVPTAP